MVSKLEFLMAAGGHGIEEYFHFRHHQGPFESCHLCRSHKDRALKDTGETPDSGSGLLFFIFLALIVWWGAFS